MGIERHARESRAVAVRACAGAPRCEAWRSPWAESWPLKSWCCVPRSGRRRRGTCERLGMDRATAEAALTDVATGEGQEVLLPGGRTPGGGWRRVGEGCRRGWDCGEQVAGADPASLGVGAGVQAVVTDLVESVGQDVLDEAAEKLDGCERGCLVTAGAYPSGGPRG